MKRKSTTLIRGVPKGALFEIVLLTADRHTEPFDNSCVQFYMWLVHRVHVSLTQAARAVNYTYKLGLIKRVAHNRYLAV